MRILTKFYPIILLIIFTFALRVIRAENLFYFTYDEAIPAFVGRRLILWLHIPLIGAVTPFGFHLGPYFYWLSAALLFLGKLNPLIWGYSGAVLASATTFLLYIVGKRIYGKQAGFIAATIWTFSYIANLLDRHFWALYWGPLISLLTVYCLDQILKKKEKYVYLLALVLAFAINTDPSNLVFLISTAVIWFIFKLPVRKSTFIAIAIILLSFLPIALFDLRHNFANTKPALKFFSSSAQPGRSSEYISNLLIFPRTFSRLIYVFGDNEVAKQYTYCKNYIKEKYSAVPPYFVFFSTLILLAFIYFAKKDKSKGPKLILTIFLAYFIGIQIYGTLFKSDVFEHYLAGLFPIYALIIAKLLSFLPRKVYFPLLILFVIFNLIKLSLAQNSLGLKNKRLAIDYTTRVVGNQDFSLDSLSTCWKYSGYRYLFTVFGREPVKSYVDPNLAYLYGATEVKEKHPKTVVSFVALDFQPETNEFYKRYNKLKLHEIKSARFGSIEVMILDNSSAWIDKE